MDELGKSLPVSEGMVDAEQGTSKTHPNEFCLNCGTPLQNVFCHHCGQKDIPQRQTLGELWTNFISSFWSYEGKFFRTIRHLMTRPGFLALEYNAGRRESYYHPARMYVFISFVFFFLFFTIVDNKSDEVIELTRSDVEQLKYDFGNPRVDSLFDRLPRNPDNPEGFILTQKMLDSLDVVTPRKVNRRAGFKLTKAEYESIAQYDSAQQALPESKRDNWLIKKLQVRAIELNKRYANKEKTFGNEVGKAFFDNSSKVIFVLLPIFALLLKLLYVRRGYFYSEHLVFSIYYYNFVYFACSILILLSLVPWLSWLSTLLGFWIFFYLLFAMKRVYQQGWGKTILKFLVLDFLFLFCVITAFAISFFWILLVI